jgi:hypothetical protein
MPETQEHKTAKNLLSKFFKDNYGLSITEYLDSGFEADVVTVLSPARKLMVEVIWSSSNANFYRDMTLVLASNAEIKIVVANQAILKKSLLLRYFERIRMSEAVKGYSLIGLLGWDPSNESSLLSALKAELDKIMPPRKEAILKNLKQLKQEIVNDNIPLPSIASQCLDISKALGLTEEMRWLQCELYGYFDYLKGEVMDYHNLPGKPEYRKVTARVNYDFEVGILREEVSLIICHPLNEIISWVNNAPSKNYGVALHLNTPSDFRIFFQEHGLSVPATIPMEVSLLSLTQILDRVRLALHKFIEIIEGNYAESQLGKETP